MTASVRDLISCGGSQIVRTHDARNLKQMTQEAVRPALGGRRLRNNVTVVPAC